MALALYRKYRPKTFADLLGQDELREVLQNAARADKIAHAYLLYGPRGTGKTTAARLIAKVANCETRRTDKKFKETGEPCNKCRPCAEIDSGHALDVIEIDAASNRGIDEIRDLKDGIRLSPTAYPFKVFIIDEMHMLTKEAFNALLKTLEEPPAHAIMVMATTEYDKVPATVSSRAQRFHFRKLTVQEIVGKLQNIATAEKLKLADDATELVAASAEGSLRDAESLLDQVASFAGTVDMETVQRILGRVGGRAVSDVAEQLLKKDLSGALRAISALYEGGHNLTDLNKELINYLRRALALKFDPTLAALYERELTREELARVKTHSTIADPNFVIPLMKSLIRAYSEMRYSPLVIAPLEVAIIENLK